MKALLSAAVAAVSIAAVAVGSAGPAEAQVRRYISFQSSCDRPVRLYISHADGYRNWHAHGPFLLGAYQAPIRLEANGITLTQTENHDLYFYAESLDGNDLWEGTDHAATFNGVTYNMRRAPVTVSGGWLNAHLTCNR